MVPVARAIADEAGGVTRTLERLQWGLVPHWAKDAKIGAKMINARGETLTEKPSFKPLLKSRRCVIPVSGFYEWQREAGSKQAHKVERSDGAPMLFAGLWTVNAALDIQSYTVITTAATSDFEAIHHRMPMILERDQISRWLEADWSDASGLVRTYEGDIAATKISNDVGKVANNHPKLLEPMGEQASLI